VSELLSCEGLDAYPRTDAPTTAKSGPTPSIGKSPITLLELLHQHWSKAQDGRGASNEVLQQRGRNQRRERVHAAVVDAPANANGYVTARLLHQDSDLGVVHRFDFSIKVRGDERPSAEPTGDTDAPAVEPQVAEPQLASGDPILVKLQSDRASLDVSGLSVEDLRSIEAQQAGQITINGLPAKGEMPRRSSKREGSEAVGDEGDIAPPGVEVQAKTEKPLSRSAAAALVDLSDEPDWPNEVWSFWARTHHLRVSDRTPFIPGKHREPFEVPATVHIEETTPAEQREAQLAAFSAAHPVHSVVECVVRSLTDTGVVVDLDNGIEGFIPLTELSWGNRVKHPNQIVAPGDSLRGVVLDISVPPARPRLSTKALTADPFEAFKDRCRPGARVSGKVDGAIDQVVFIDLGNDVDGSIHISELDHVRLESASDFAPVGTAIDVEVMGFDDASRRVNLSRKRLLPHPYDEYKRNHGVGEMVVAQVDRVSPTHVNVKVGALDGVVHVSNLRWERVADATTLYASGSTLKARLLKFNDAKRQLELSVKALLPEPYENFKRQHSVGDATDFTVARVSRTHVNVLHAGGAPGVLHVSQIDHSRVEDASSRYGAGDSIRAKIIRFNDERRQVELSIKALLPQPYPAFKARTQIGVTISAEVTGFNDYFAYVRLADGVDGSIHVSQISTARVGKPSEALTRGQCVTAVVVGFDDQRKKVQLSLRQTPSASVQPSVGSRPAATAPPRAPATRSAPTPPAAPQPSTSPAPRVVTAEGETVTEAIATACRQLGVPTSAVRHEVLDPGSPKKFLRPSRPARVRVTTRQ